MAFPRTGRIDARGDQRLARCSCLVYDRCVTEEASSPGAAPTHTSDSGINPAIARAQARAIASKSEPAKETLATLDLDGPDSAAVSFALERERVLQRTEHTGSVRRLRRALTLGGPAWSVSVLMDWWVASVGGGGPFWFYIAARLCGGMVAGAVLYRVSREPEPSPRQLSLLDLLVFTTAAGLNAGMACLFGGLTSPYAAGMLVILVGRGSTTLEPRRHGAWMLGIPALAYVGVLLVGGLVNERLAAQFRDPVQLGCFIIFLCFLAMAWLHLTLGADFAWRLRREALETRNIGRYKLERRLGRGGMAEVWAAYDVALKHRVALKTVSGHRPGSSALARLEREARALAGLTHPNTVRVFDYGVTDDGLWYYTMELLQGDSLRDLVTRSGPLPVDRLLYIARQVLRALGEAHGKGIVHRDIKPENVFVAELGGEHDFVKLLDFGIAKAIVGSDIELTHSGWVTGTPAYMPPEVILGEPADIRSDIYCFGAMLYFAATGKLPFTEATHGNLLAAHLNSEPPSFSSAGVASLPPELEQVVRHCLAKLPKERYPSTHAVLEALARIA
jgi:eukaryotic-like serine/threonine-protein kinase